MEQLKELPKNFLIKTDISNPLWQPFISWLNRRKYYRGYWDGTSYDYYGIVNGERKYCNSVIYQLITLEQWDAIVNHKKFVLPEQWCIRFNDDNRLVLENWIKSHFDFDFTYAPTYREFSDFEGCLSFSSPLPPIEDGKYRILIPEDEIGGCSRHDGSYMSVSLDIPKGYTEITFDLFKKHVLKEDLLEKAQKQPKEPEYFMLLAEHGTHPPRFVHTGFDSAEKEAKRLVVQLNSKVTILKVIGSFHPIVDITVSEFQHYDELPF